MRSWIISGASGPGTMDCGARARDRLVVLPGRRTFRSRAATRGYIVTNGPVFSPGHDCLYHNDTGRGVVYRFAVGADGEIHDKSEFLKFPPDWGSAGWHDGGCRGWLVDCSLGRRPGEPVHPDGKLERAIPLPVSQITNCVFAGAGLDRMFVTSAAVGREDEPLAGALFEVDAGGVKGLAPQYFAG